ncbi:hypothetical protein DICPUDRAFT_146841 [Dictyostelium purpureum]|uniref:Corrinoid adenosyltransferase MMAB n=1 Tax=Dictyostelium purpureum TaxID=5786 RepID=F0Z714_DICPU|nr:uncharacterized protein DICPUDRAFT_146841 [Dictyostelium purpureum]EGC40298.1 hypothetical protein DICPUDRAFT_146841 [Dictyostelium purpureum]|eukprot:XP_003283234.1 hypothetical protein DICPUDRAFT_146841 [Dictyostelium purpureum]
MSDSEEEYRSKLYTKTGDKGTSALFNGERRPKNDAFFHSLGAIDELSATLGIALEHCIIEKNGLESYLEKLIVVMLDIGACVATPLDNSKDSQINKTKFDDNRIKVIESWIDKVDSELPPLKCFIIPYRVGLASAHLHLARTVCRRAEREMVGLSRHSFIPESVSIFINRLSDFLFAAARYAAMKNGAKEDLWRGVTSEFS